MDHKVEKAPLPLQAVWTPRCPQVAHPDMIAL